MLLLLHSFNITPPNNPFFFRSFHNLLAPLQSTHYVPTLQSLTSTNTSIPTTLRSRRPYNAFIYPHTINKSLD